MLKPIDPCPHHPDPETLEAIWCPFCGAWRLKKEDPVQYDRIDENYPPELLTKIEKVLVALGPPEIVLPACVALAMAYVGGNRKE